MFTFRRLFIAVLAATALAMLPVAPAEADHRSGDRSEVDFEITGARCTIEVIHQRELRNGTLVVTTEQTGPTDSSIALLVGEMTVRATAVIPPDRPGRTFGRWTLDPDASSGTVSGWFRGSISSLEPGAEATEIRSTGWGRGALRGVRVKMTTSTPAPVGDAPCPADLAFAGSGTASYPQDRAPVGAVVTQSTKSFDRSVADLTAAIEGNPNLRLIRTVDHRAAAATRDLVLPPTTELFFGNPRLGTPLMQASQTTGIDLPQKMLIWEDLFGVVRVGYNAPAYLASRHSIEGVDPQLQTIAGALAGLAGVATGTTVDPVFDAGRVGADEGLVQVGSDRSAADAYAAILVALEAAPPVNVAIALEHDVNAANVGLELRPTKLAVFGNPSLGSLLMQSDQSVALDLPQKILVYEDEAGKTVIAYNDPGYVAKRHGIGDQREVIATLNGALANFAAAGQ